MANCRWCVVGFGALMMGTGAVGSATPATLRESARVGDSTQVLITLEADGHYRPAPPSGTPKAEPGKRMALKVETRLDFAERVVNVDAEGRARRVARWVVQAASAINGEIRPTGAVLRPEVSLLVAEPRRRESSCSAPAGR